MHVPKLSPRLQPRSLVYDNFRIGVCRQGDPTEIRGLRDCQNAVMSRFGFRKRPGTTKKGTTLGTVKITGLGDSVVKGNLYHFAVCGQILKKWKQGVDSDWSNTDKTTLTTELNTTIKQFVFQDGSSVENGTFDTGSTTRKAIDATKAWTVDEYIGFIVHIDGGTGVGQRKLIVGNDADALYVNEPFDTAPDATSTYDIYAVDDLACFANNSQTPWKWNATGSSDINTPAVFRDIEVHDGRLWGLFKNDIYFSDEGFGDQFSRDSLIPYTNGDRFVKRIQKLNEQLVVYKDNSFAIVSGRDGNYGIQERSKSVGLYAANSLATGAEMQFFLSKCGIEVVNRFEHDITKEVLPISENIKDWLAEHSAAELQLACGIVEDNYYKITIPLGSLYYTYRYDILRSDYASPNPDRQIWDRYLGQDANVWGMLDGDLHFGSNKEPTQAYVKNAKLGNDDDGSAIAVVVQTRDEDYKLPDVDKEFNKVHVFAETSTADIDYVVKYRINKASSWTTLGTVNTLTGLDTERKVTFDLYKSGRTLAIQVTRSDSLAHDEAEIIKVLVHYNLDQRE